MKVDETLRAIDTKRTQLLSELQERQEQRDTGHELTATLDRLKGETAAVPKHPREKRSERALTGGGRP